MGRISMFALSVVLLATLTGFASAGRIDQLRKKFENNNNNSPQNAESERRRQKEVKEQQEREEAERREREEREQREREEKEQREAEEREQREREEREQKEREEREEREQREREKREREQQEKEQREREQRKQAENQRKQREREKQNAKRAHVPEELQGDGHRPSVKQLMKKFGANSNANKKPSVAAPSVERVPETGSANVKQQMEEYLNHVPRDDADEVHSEPEPEQPKPVIQEPVPKPVIPEPTPVETGSGTDSQDEGGIEAKIRRYKNAAHHENSGATAFKAPHFNSEDDIEARIQKFKNGANHVTNHKRPDEADGELAQNALFKHQVTEEAETNGNQEETAFEARCKWTYNGCYRISNAKLLTPASVSGALTPKLCAKRCKDMKMPFAAIGGHKHDQRCYCGSSLGHEKGACEAKCPGNNFETCGGYNSLTVFKCMVPSKWPKGAEHQVCPLEQWQKLGCVHQTKAGVRGKTLSLIKSQPLVASTYGECVQLCSKNGFIQSGYNQQHCYCGTFFEFQATKLENAVCDKNSGGIEIGGCRWYCAI